MSLPARRIHVVVNPASGPGVPVLKHLADVCREHDVEWDISITREFGDAERQAREALDRGVDLVIGSGGDGTQHEIASAVLPAGKPMGVLPGGTGNGFAAELGIPSDYRKAVEVICTSANIRQVDAMRIGEGYGIQRLYAGIEPEAQVSRAQKDRYGTIAYALMAPRQLGQAVDAPMTLTIDGEVIETHGVKVYVVNSGRGGKGTIDPKFRVDDGVLDVFVMSRNPMSLLAAAERMLQVPSPWGRLYRWSGRDIRVDCEPSKAIWVDGEAYGRTPIDVQVLPSALSVVVP